MTNKMKEEKKMAIAAYTIAYDENVDNNKVSLSDEEKQTLRKAILQSRLKISNIKDDEECDTR